MTNEREITVISKGYEEMSEEAKERLDSLLKKSFETEFGDEDWTPTESK